MCDGGVLRIGGHVILIRVSACVFNEVLRSLFSGNVGGKVGGNFDFGRGADRGVAFDDILEALAQRLGRCEKWFGMLVFDIVAGGLGFVAPIDHGADALQLGGNRICRQVVRQSACGGRVLLDGRGNLSRCGVDQQGGLWRVLDWARLSRCVIVQQGFPRDQRRGGGLDARCGGVGLAQNDFVVFHACFDTLLDLAFSDAMQHVCIRRGRFCPKIPIIGGQVAEILRDGLHRVERLVEPFERARECAV